MTRACTQFRTFGLLIAAIIAAGCSDSRTPVEATVPGSASLAKGGPGVAKRFTSAFWATGSENAIQPDNRYLTAMPGFSEYRHGVCGVKSDIEIGNRGGDHFFHPTYSWTKADKTNCAAPVAPRSLMIVYKDDPTTAENEATWGSGPLWSLYVRRLYYVGDNDWGSVLPYPETEPIIANWIYTMDIGDGICGRLWFNPVRYPGSSLVPITPMTVNGQPGWEVQGGTAWCENKNRTIPMQFVLRIQDLGITS